MAISFTNLGASSVTPTNPDIRSNTDATSYSNAAWLPPSSLIVAFILSRTANSDATSPPVEPTITHTGMTWVKIATVTFNSSGGINRGRLSLWACDNTGGGAANAATTFGFGTQTQTRCDVSFFQIDGVDLSGGVAAAFVQAPTNTGATLTTLSVTLSAAGNANNRPIAGFAHSETEATTPRASWTEMDDMNSASPNSGLETQVRSDAFETTASASWTGNVACAGIAAEVKASGGGSTTTLTADNGSFADNGQAAAFARTMVSNHGSFS